MSQQAVTTPRLLTWLDVERLLKAKTALWSKLPKHIISIDCFADCLEIRLTESSSEVFTWLADIFGNAYHREAGFLKLLIGSTKYPIQIFEEPSLGTNTKLATYPLWKDVSYLPGVSCDDEVEGSHQPYPNRWSNGPDIVSFHSFKGGVGRTTSLMTYVSACMHDATIGPKKILVIDADLEAPGVSFWLDDINRPKVSFVQLMEALHYPPASVEDTLEYFADELRKTSISISGMQRELFVLPAALDLSEIQDMPVTPEHLARNPENPWRLADYLHALGAKLGVDAIFIDLRAGLSELASPVLFDPRIDHFFVSTIAPQSIMGMAEVIRKLHAFNRRLPDDMRDQARPTVILSLLTKELRETEGYERALRTLAETYPTDDALTSGIQWLEADFSTTLMSIGSVREALTSLKQSSSLFSNASEWASAFYSISAPVPEVAAPASNSRQSLAKSMFVVCEKAQFAESDVTAPILATEPLLNLGKQYSKDLPNLLMIGAKGAGKTFTYRQVVRTGTWRRFLEKLGFDGASLVDGFIFPALWSSNIEDTPTGEIKNAQKTVTTALKTSDKKLIAGSKLFRTVKEALKNPPTSWEDFWDDTICKQLGTNNGGFFELNEKLIKKDENIVLVFDGIEDAFEDTSSNTAIDAIQALLRLTNRLGELENRHIGTIIFVRADYVQAATRQNLGQLLQRFQPFRLQWNPESFLRLAFMLSCQAGIYQDDPKSAELLRIEQLKDKLEVLWGRKLGGEKSKEAHSARWVYAALCDLKGNVQARDLVRFLKFASEIESDRVGPTWPDRILSPESMRKAIPSCSQEKVTEARAEIAPLRNWIKTLEDNGIRSLKVPFSPAAVFLTTDLLTALQEIGVIYEDVDGNLGEERLFLPEIYRSGLGFETSAAGRPRMQALLKKNIGNIPL